ncbi:hypothetical protein BDV11DRAFT_191240, partial [Aspergillus similis]
MRGGMPERDGGFTIYLYVVGLVAVDTSCSTCTNKMSTDIQYLRSTDMPLAKIDSIAQKPRKRLLAKHILSSVFVTDDEDRSQQSL